MDAMRGSRVGSVLIRAATRQIYGVQRTAPASHFVLNYSTVAKSQTLHSRGSIFHGDELAVAWSAFVHHMSTAVALAEGKMPSGKPSPGEALANVSEKPDLKQNFEKPTDISSYWDVVPKVQYKDDGSGRASQ